MAGKSPDRHHADTGTAPAQTEGKVTGMAVTLGGMLRGTGTGDRRGRGGELRLGSAGRLAAAGERGPLAGPPPTKRAEDYPPY